MSAKASSWAWESSQATGSAFLVLLALADHAGADGGDCWPSVARLSRRCRVDERTVQRAIDRLVELGEVVVEEGGGRGRSNRYRLTLGANPRPQGGDKPVDETPAGRHPSGETPAPRHPSEDAKPRHPDVERVASAPVKGGTTPGELEELPVEPPQPPEGSAPHGSAMGPPGHHGQHRNCRACGTSPRDAAQRAEAARELSDAERRRRALAESTEAHRAMLAEAAANAVPPPPDLRNALRAPAAPEDETGAA